jgi:D-psicose/D-tagatose/L-ribulose 3-epimerase
MFKFGVDSWIWTEVFEEKDIWVLKRAKELGFEVLDINIAYPEKFPLRAVKEEQKKTGMEIVITTILEKKGNIISPDSDVRKVGVSLLKKLVDISNSLDAKIFGGVNYAAWSYTTGKTRTEQEWEWSINSMKEVAKYAEETGKVTICVEPINRFETHFLNVAEDAIKYCKDVGAKNMKVHLDTYHMNIEEANLVEAFRLCGKEFLGYVHAAENNRGIPGTGHVPWEGIFKEIKKIGYYGPLVIESFDPSMEVFVSGAAYWRGKEFADTGEELAIKGLENLKSIAAKFGE